MKESDKIKFSTCIQSKGTIRGELGAIKSIAQCRIRLFLRYPLNALWLIMLPLGFMVALFSFSSLVDYTAYSEGMGGETSMASYTFIGLSMLFLSNIVGNGSIGLLQEQMLGIMEPTLATPIPRLSYVLGLILGETVTSGIFSLIMAVIGLIAFGGATSSLPNIALSIIVILLTLVSFFGLAFIFSALALRYKQLGGVYGLFTFLLQFTSGIFIPVRSLPLPLQYVAFCIPLTWELDAFRSLLLGTTPLIHILLEIVLIASLSLATVLVGSILFKKAERRIKEMGTVSLY